MPPLERSTVNIEQRTRAEAIRGAASAATQHRNKIAELMSDLPDEPTQAALAVAGAQVHATMVLGYEQRVANLLMANPAHGVNLSIFGAVDA